MEAVGRGVVEVIGSALSAATNVDFGIPHIWIVDAAARIGWDCSDGNWLRKERFGLDTPIYLSLPEMFAELDEAEKE